MKEYMNLRKKIVAQLMGCNLFVGIPLDSCKPRCYKNRAER